ncbi:Zinc finger cw-type pwwp domain protein 2 [Plakobranchus ocellatus]|uniref:Zinc finger cw-type pwwp domain protein 2 n=1 Tax=Plakobranchus ocellatus TaxID=259542 RepID=A0AAV3XYT5_9GAST|nr:Zinc finger cw-type pwwp domain protein 2 [Plakobranchus ocellatus]
MLRLLRKRSISPKNVSPSPSLSTISKSDLDLRNQLSSVAWVQCDNPKCLKWRKISNETAKGLTDTIWTCDMNKDTDFQSCSVPEEDTASYDKLAKKAKLDLIKSEIKTGSLVSAKTDGYCRWPALVTADPACDIHMDGDDEEILWYHVEYLGGERSHAWVRANRVEIFGIGNCHKLNKTTASKKKKGRKREKGTLTTLKTKKLRKTYKGCNTIQEAVSEAISLLSWPQNERLKTCWFVSEDKHQKRCGSSTDKKKKKTVKKLKQKNTCKLSYPTNGVHIKLKAVESFDNHNHAKVPGLDMKENLDVQKGATRKKGKRKHNIGKKAKDGEPSDISQNYFMDKEHAFDEGKKKKEGHDFIRTPAGLRYLHFPSSLLGSSKEDRLILDVQVYKKNEKMFEDDVLCFMSSQGLSLSSPPVWQNVKVSVFSIFLAVYERGGFEKVCDNHQWGNVYCEVTYQHTNQGSSEAKRFYRRNLYPYELFVSGQDYTLTVRALQQIPSEKICHLDDIEDSGCSSMSEMKVDNFDGSEFSGQGDTLDEILLTLNQEEKDDRQVPDMLQTFQSSYLLQREHDSMEQHVDTASGPDRAAEPEENAQVVPELDFPSSLDSSQMSNDVQDFHEMQALQLDVGDLNDEINIL